MKKVSYVPLKNTIINALGTLLSRISGIMKFNVVNYLFGAGADTFYSANANILSLRKVFGEGPLVNAFLPIFSKEKTKDAIAADEFASNILNQVIIVSFVITIIGILVTPLWTSLFLPGFKDNPQEFKEIIALTSIMIFSTVFFSVFSVAMGILNSHERFFASANAPILSNIVFIVFPLLTYKSLGIMSLAWAIVIGTFFQCILEMVELYMIGFKYRFILNFTDSRTKAFWKLYVPVALNYLAQSGISIGLGYFASFLPRGSMTYLRNANTIMIAPVGFIGVAISGAIFPIFAKVKEDRKKLSQAWMQGLIFFLFLSIPISLFFTFYPDVIVNLIFRDISLLFTGSTGKFSQDLLDLTTKSVQILGTVLIPWSLNIIISKIFYALEQPKLPLILILVNFVLNISGYKLAQIFNWGGMGLVYSDLITGWITTFLGMIIVFIELKNTLPEYWKTMKQTLLFIILSTIVWLGLRPLYYIYISATYPLLLIIFGSLLFILGLGIFGGLTYLFKICPLIDRHQTPYIEK